MHTVATEYLHQVMVMQHLPVSLLGFVVCLGFFWPDVVVREVLGLVLRRREALYGSLCVVSKKI